ncbi:Kinetochore protein Spc24 [Recurvomyces mirabilis]|uniref:Kinetochore protein Spc24 n=1 Tax=Recurvomyces mirabilis TaxID=574656 RepID=A0AAE1C1V2_9PEZI|nr:Kinetochore protein Spc24 [Recurvomyces mirabilis]KAK5152582.1 Kinetochore protein Spc24 [Recurvomyces mirabilis]
MALKGRPAKRLKLLDEASDASDESADEGVQLGQNNGPANEFKINENYAKRFEHNKKREEKHRLEEKYGDGSGKRGLEEEEDDEEDSEDETEDDDAELADVELDAEIFDTLRALKSKDPRIYDSTATFYRDFEAEDGAEQQKEKKEKPMYLQDYHRENLMSGFAGGEDGEVDDRQPVQTYQQEQDAVRAALVGSMHASAQQDDSDDKDDDDDEELFQAKKKSNHESIPTTKTTSKPITENDITSADQDPETYLSNFMSARAWLANGESKYIPLDEDDSEDEQRADKFENAFNLRFEDPAHANETLMSFRRDIGGDKGVRREELSGRQRAREREKERKAAEKREREEERARLKKLKVEEVEEKVARIREAAGLRGKDVDLREWRGMIEGDFAEDEWEAEMGRRFGEEYYDAAETGEGSDDEDEGAEKSKHKKVKAKKPKWEDEIDINDLVPDFVDEDDRAEFSLSEEEDDVGSGAALPDGDRGVGMRDDEDDDGDGGEQGTATTKRKTKKDRQQEKQDAKRIARKQRQAIESLVDAALPISNPNLATKKVKSTSSGPAGFRYRDTSPTSFGLSARDILFAEDAQLNQFVGLKKMHAFRDEEKKRKDKKRFSKKGRVKMWRRECFGDEKEGGGKEFGVEDGEEVGGRGDVGGTLGRREDAEGNVKEGERRKKRKRSGKGKKEGNV